MKTIRVFETRDGALHRTADKARRHAQAAHSQALARIGHALVKADGKYMALQECVMSNLDAICELRALAQDMVIEAPESDDD